MTKEELIARLQDIEWSDFEVKAAKSDLPKSIWETVCAFANGSGGWIVLGVKQRAQSFEIHGVDNVEKLEQDFFCTLRSQKFNVKLFAIAYKYDIEGKRVLAFFIPSSETKPVYIGSPANTFIRMGSGDQRATQHEVMALFRDQSFGVRSEQSVPDTNIHMLNQSSLHNFRAIVRLQKTLTQYDGADDEEFCRKVGITDRNGCLTYGGLITFGEAPYTFRYIPTFCADYVEIPGSGKGAMTNNYTYRIPEQENLWDAAKIIERRLRTLVDTPMTGISEYGLAEEDSSQLEILREAMANMMMHADHFSPMRSCIHVFDDRIEFLNPGGFPKSVDEIESQLTSLPRNPVIAKLFRLAKLSENLGYGIPKLKRWEQLTGRKMTIHAAIDHVVVTFYFKNRQDDSSDNSGFNGNVGKNVGKNVDKKFSDRQRQILEFMKESPMISLVEMSKRLGVSSKTVEREIARMSDIVRRVGSKKGGHWKVEE